MAESLYSFAAAQIRQVDHESAADDRSAGGADQPERRFSRAAGCNQVVDEQDVLAALNPVGVQLEPVGAVLELVVVTEVFGRELPLFADRHETDIQSMSERGADNKAARFDPRDLVDWAAAIRRTEFLDDRVKAIRLFEQGRDVAKQNARLGKIGDSPNQRLDVDVLHHVCSSAPGMTLHAQ